MVITEGITSGAQPFVSAYSSEVTRRHHYHRMLSLRTSMLFATRKNDIELLCYSQRGRMMSNFYAYLQQGGLISNFYGYSSLSSSSTRVDAVLRSIFQYLRDLRELLTGLCN